MCKSILRDEYWGTVLGEFRVKNVRCRLIVMQPRKTSPNARPNTQYTSCTLWTNRTQWNTCCIICTICIIWTAAFHSPAPCTVYSSDFGYAPKQVSEYACVCLRSLTAHFHELPQAPTRAPLVTAMGLVKAVHTKCAWMQCTILLVSAAFVVVADVERLDDGLLLWMRPRSSHVIHMHTNTHMLASPVPTSLPPTEPTTRQRRRIYDGHIAHCIRRRALPDRRHRGRQSGTRDAHSFYILVYATQNWCNDDCTWVNTHRTRGPAMYTRAHKTCVSVRDVNAGSSAARRHREPQSLISSEFECVKWHRTNKNTTSNRTWRATNQRKNIMHAKLVASTRNVWTTRSPHSHNPFRDWTNRFATIHARRARIGHTTDASRLICPAAGWHDYKWSLVSHIGLKTRVRVPKTKSWPDFRAHIKHTHTHISKKKTSRGAPMLLIYATVPFHWIFSFVYFLDSHHPHIETSNGWYICTQSSHARSTCIRKRHKWKGNCAVATHIIAGQKNIHFHSSCAPNACAEWMTFVVGGMVWRDRAVINFAISIWYTASTASKQTFKRTSRACAQSERHHFAIRARVICDLWPRALAPITSMVRAWAVWSKPGRCIPNARCGCVDAHCALGLICYDDDVGGGRQPSVSCCGASYLYPHATLVIIRVLSAAMQLMLHNSARRLQSHYKPNTHDDENRQRTAVGSLTHTTMQRKERERERVPVVPGNGGYPRPSVNNAYPEHSI